MTDTTQQMFWTRDRIMQLLIGLAIATALVLLIRYLSDVLLPFFAACFIAYILQPIVEFNRRWTRSKGRVLASILTILEVSAILAAVIYLFLPTVLKELGQLSDIIKSVTSGTRKIPDSYVSAINFISRYFDPDNIQSILNTNHLETLINKGSSLLE